MKITMVGNEIYNNDVLVAKTVNIPSEEVATEEFRNLIYLLEGKDITASQLLSFLNNTDKKEELRYIDKLIEDLACEVQQRESLEKQVSRLQLRIAELLR